jgi:hypothetical protein
MKISVTGVCCIIRARPVTPLGAQCGGARVLRAVAGGGLLAQLHCSGASAWV